MFKKFTQKLKQGLAKTKDKLVSGLKTVLPFGRELDADLIDKMEEHLYGADIGPRTVAGIMDKVREAHKTKQITTTDECFDFLRTTLKGMLAAETPDVPVAAAGPTVILVAGINGSGKTTSIAKLAWIFREQGKSVLLGAADTFRAAAVEQLSIWAERMGADIVKKPQGSDPASVAFDACEAAVARGVDVVIIDTAGRLHTQKNLMQELEKIKRVIGKKIEDAPHEVMLVLDANNGQNAIAQAEAFKGVVDVTGLFLTKLDGTAKGGSVIGIRHQIDVPVKFIGVGEKPEDIEKFDSDAFVEALFETS